MQNIIAQHEAEQRKKLKAISLCSGIGAWDMSIEEGGYDIVLQVEKDQTKQAVLEDAFPHIPKCEDVDILLKEGPIKYGLNAEELTVFAGLPCQPLSTAGPQRGSKSDNYLWGKFVDLTDKYRFRTVVLENVKGAVRHKDGLPYLRTCMARLSYNERFSAIIPASAFGLPHERYRLFTVFGRDKIFSDADGIRRYLRGLSSIEGPKVFTRGEFEQSLQESGIECTLDGTPDKADRELLQGIGNAVEHETGLFIAKVVRYYDEFWYESEVGRKAVKTPG